MRIRTVKPEWLDDEGLHEAGLVARLMSICLITLADDYGNGRAHKGQLAGRLFWNEDDGLAKVREGLASLTRVGFLKLYRVRGQAYFHVVNWSKHQRVDKPGKPRVPGPEEAEPGSGDPTDGPPPREVPAKVREASATDRDPDHDHDREQSRASTREAPPPQPKLPSESWDPPTHPEGVWRLLVNACALAGLDDPGACGGIRRQQAAKAMKRVDPAAMPDDFRAWAEHVKGRDRPPSDPWLNWCDHWGSWAQRAKARDERSGRGRTIVPSAEETNRLIAEREQAYRADQARRRAPSEMTGMGELLLQALEGAKP